MPITSSALDFVNGDTAPTAPASGSLTLYPKNGVWYFQTSGGAEATLAGVATLTNSDGTIVIGGTSPNLTVSRAGITGDVSIAAGGNSSALATVNTNTGNFGSATQVPTVTLDGKGRVTAASNTSIQIAESQVTNLVSDLSSKQPTGNYVTALTGDVTASGPGSSAATLSSVITAGGPTGSSSVTPVITYDAKGRLTAVTTATITPAAIGAVSSVSAGNSTITIGGTSSAPTIAVNEVNLPMNVRTFRPQNYGTLTYDGSVSCDTAFTAMMSAVNTLNNRCKIEIPPGVFLVSAGVMTFTGSAPIEIKGSGRFNTVLYQPTGTTADYIVLGSSMDGVGISDLAIYQAGTPNTAGSGINTNGADDVRIRDLFFVGQFYDINVNNTSIKVSIQSTVHSQTNGSSGSVGVLVNNGLAGDTYIGPDVVMSNAGATRRRACVEVLVSGHYEINQANLTGSQYGVIVDPGAGQIVGFGFHNEILCDSNTIAGMLLNAATATSTIKSIKSTNSWYSGTVSGVGTSGVITQGVAGGIINGVSHINDRFLNSQQHGYLHQFGTDFRWVGCDVKGNGAQTANTYDGINVAAGVSNWSITGGKIGGTDTVAGSGNQRYGINAAAGAGTQISVTGVDLIGNTTAPWAPNAITGLVTLANNIGMVTGRPANIAATNIPAATVTNVDSLGGIPIPANVRPGTQVRFVVSATNAATAQTFTATVRYGTTNTNTDAAIFTFAHTVGTAAVGSALFEVDVMFLTTTTAMVQYKAFNGNNAATGMFSGAIQIFSGLATPATIATNVANFLGLYFSSSTANIITIRSVAVTVISQ